MAISGSVTPQMAAMYWMGAASVASLHGAYLEPREGHGVRF
jgi:hypothetical protein